MFEFCNMQLIYTIHVYIYYDLGSQCGLESVYISSLFIDINVVLYTLNAILCCGNFVHNII